jgi:hypothetical protein
VRTPTFSVAVITLPVSDVERALRFYVDQIGFTLDVDYSPNDAFRVVQLTALGSSCSIQIGSGLTDAPVGSLRNVYLVVTKQCAPVSSKPTSLSALWRCRRMLLWFIWLPRRVQNNSPVLRSSINSTKNFTTFTGRSASRSPFSVLR